MWPSVWRSLFLLPLLFAVICANDSVKHDISTQGRVLEVRRRASRDCRWPAGLDSSVDFIIEGGKIHAYKIQWFSGRWSGWYIPGVNDLDWKFNVWSRRCQIPYKRNSMRRVWSYFYDHNHMFIISKPQKGYSGPASPKKATARKEIPKRPQPVSKRPKGDSGEPNGRERRRKPLPHKGCCRGHACRHREESLC